jgi:hypothetical protein
LSWMVHKYVAKSAYSHEGWRQNSEKSGRNELWP